MICNSRSCVYRLCRLVEPIPYKKEIVLSKRRIRELPVCFEETLLGEPEGAIKQFRGPFGSHIREYANSWELHKDMIDPRIDPLGHLVNDAPHILGILALIGLALLPLVITTRESDE